MINKNTVSRMFPIQIDRKINKHVSTSLFPSTYFHFQGNNHFRELELSFQQRIEPHSLCIVEQAALSVVFSVHPCMKLNAKWFIEIYGSLKYTVSFCFQETPLHHVLSHLGNSELWIFSEIIVEEYTSLFVGQVC